MNLRFIEPLERRLFLDATVEIRVNQVGYRPDDQKIAVVMSGDDLAGQMIDVTSADGTVRAHLKIGRDRGVYGAWGHLCEIDLSQITDAGRYRLQLNGHRSADFEIGQMFYQPLIPLTLQFFQVQRSGDTNPADHAPSHLTDGVAANGPMKGQHIDVSGGWYDAGDYLKFTLTGGMVSIVMLTSYLDHPELFAGQEDSSPRRHGEHGEETDGGAGGGARATSNPSAISNPSSSPSATANPASTSPSASRSTSPSSPLRDLRASVVNSNSPPAILAETKIELDWLTKMWDAKDQILYYQVGDSKDHDDYGWRLPDGDDKLHPNRPVFACEAGKGANLAGKMSASLALAAKLWSDPKQPWHDDALAAKYRDAATSLYEFGKAHPAAQSATDHFYDEDSWQDDMALGGAEMYRLTGDRHYLNDAEKWANQVGSQHSFDYSDLNGLACYQIAQLDPKFKTNAVAALKHDLQSFSADASANQWGAAQKHFDWGSGAQMAGASLEAMWYQALTGDPQFRLMAIRQRDYLLGANPWNISMLSGAGTNWPHHPHHQIADIKHIDLPGFWAEGPVAKKIFSDEHIKLRVRPDPLAAFQTGGAVYHDDTEDYTTNEPTLDMNATSLGMTAWFADASHHAATKPNN